jgi:hypothetical protein
MDDNLAELLMLRGVLALCADCADERLFVPTDPDDPTGEYCCTSCDAAVFLMTVVGPARRRSRRRVA